MPKGGSKRLNQVNRERIEKKRNMLKKQFRCPIHTRVIAGVSAEVYPADTLVGRDRESEQFDVFVLEIVPRQIQREDFVFRFA